VPLGGNLLRKEAEVSVPKAINLSTEDVCYWPFTSIAATQQMLLQLGGKLTCPRLIAPVQSTCCPTWPAAVYRSKFEAIVRDERQSDTWRKAIWEGESILCDPKVLTHDSRAFNGRQYHERMLCQRLRRLHMERRMARRLDLPACSGNTI
jgi:hypothetical protein